MRAWASITIRCRHHMWPYPDEVRPYRSLAEVKKAFRKALQEREGYEDMVYCAVFLGEPGDDFDFRYIVGPKGGIKKEA